MYVSASKFVREQSRFKDSAKQNQCGLDNLDSSFSNKEGFNIETDILPQSMGSVTIKQFETLISDMRKLSSSGSSSASAK